MPREERGSLTSCQVRGRHTPPTQSQRSQDWNWGRGTVGLGLGDWTGALRSHLWRKRTGATSEDLRQGQATWVCHQGAGGGAGDFFLLQAKACIVSPPTQSCQMPSPSPPCPPATPPWQASNWAPPSPVFCHGCNQWCDLVEVYLRRV